MPLIELHHPQLASVNMIRQILLLSSDPSLHELLLKSPAKLDDRRSQRQHLIAWMMVYHVTCLDSPRPIINHDPCISGRRVLSICYNYS